MRSVLLALLAIVVLLAAVGCGREAARQSTATEVANPAEKAPQPPPEAAAPAPPPAPVPAAAPAPKPGKDGWVTLPDGLKYKDKKVGKGATAAVGQQVTVHYKGWLDNGKVFDASRRHGTEPVTFGLVEGGLIKGWVEGIPGMRVGGVRELVIPPKLGYGDEDKGTIPPNSTLHFTVELIGVAG